MIRTESLTVLQCNCIDVVGWAGSGVLEEVQAVRGGCCNTNIA